ncbi:MAG TPA: YheC/YheD family protein [Syntrophomonadaceae bacterium]|nr:YheC/YheD family protein [Syntrophomonadaceae bacterium]
MTAQGVIYLSSALALSLGLPLKPRVNIRAGNIVTTARILIRPGEKTKYRLSPELNHALCLNKAEKYQLRYDAAADMLHIGPIIGIFSSFLPNRPEYAADSVQAELIFLCGLNRTLPAHIFVFTPFDIDWDRNTVRGYTYHQAPVGNGFWISSLYPLPDVVYDRVASRAIESRAIVKSTKKRLRSLPYLKYFNPAFLNKWRVYQLLASNIQLCPYLPETRYLNPVNLAVMLEKYDTLFLKPSNGSLGRGIIRVTKSERRLKFTVYKRYTIRGIVNDYKELLSKTRQYRERKPYIVQEGIKLIPYNKAPFDIRIIYQKNGQGEWQVTKKFVRVAPQGSNISNLSSGGRAEKLDQVFRTLYNGNTSAIEAQNRHINTICQMVATTLETASNSIYGELGLDIGIDQDNIPRLIEVNSKPRKSTQTNFSKGIVRNSFRRPMEYAIYLAGFQP